MRLAAVRQYTSGQLVHSVSQKAVHKEQQQLAPAAGMLFYASSGLLKFTCEVDFFSRETRLAHYNFCLQKWTYFLVLDMQGIVLHTLIQEVSFLSRYKNKKIKQNILIKCKMWNICSPHQNFNSLYY